MAKLTRNFGFGGDGLTPWDNNPLKDLLEALIDEVVALREREALLLAKLDADAGVTDNDYVSSIPQPAVKLEKE